MAPENSQATGRVIEVQCGDLIGPALDWAVAKVEEVEVTWRYGRELVKVCDSGGIKLIESIRSIYSPSTAWAQGGPLIDKHHLDFCCEHPETIGAALCDENGMYIDDRMMFGKTHLIAACRAIVAARLGEVVSVPAELIQATSV